MARELCIESVTIARALAKFGKQPNLVTTLSPQFRIPEPLWKRIERYVSESPKWKPTDLLLGLFDISKNNQQKALIGSLMMEHGMRLNVRKEKDYINALLDCGLAPQAIKIWRERKVGQEIEESMHARFLIQIYCRLLRVKDAENLTLRTQITPKLASDFILAYLQVQDEAGVDRWTTALLESDWNAPILNQTLSHLVKFQMWSPAKRVMNALTARGISIPAHISAACILAAKGKLNEASIAMILSRDGSVINSPLLKLALGKDPRRVVDILLKEDKFDEAMTVFESVRSQHDLALCYKLFRWLLPKAKQDRSEFLALMEPIVKRAQNCKGPSGLYARLMISYYYAARNFEKLWDTVATYDLVSLDPKVSPIRAFNYEILWRAVTSTVHSKQRQYIPFSLRELLIVTVTRNAMSSGLLHYMVLSLSKVGDIQGLVTLIEYAIRNCGVELDQKTIQVLIPGEHGVSTSDWRTVAQRICSANSRNLDEIQFSASQLRQHLYMN